MRIEQDYSAIITWTSSWAKHLAENSGIDVRNPNWRDAWAALRGTDGGMTIIGAAVDCDDDRINVAGSAIAGLEDSILFRVSQSGLAHKTTVTCVVTATLSNGDIDQRDFPILFTNT